MTQQFIVGDRVRVDIPDETDLDHDRYHGRHGEVSEMIKDDAPAETGEERDGVIYRVKFNDGTTADHPSLVSHRTAVQQ